MKDDNNIFKVNNVIEKLINYKYVYNIYNYMILGFTPL